jgi:hypothetical protein
MKTTMTDTEVQNLVRMASEIDQLEREALLGPALRLAGTAPRPATVWTIRHWLSMAGVAAAAAGLALAGLMGLQAMSTPTVQPGQGIASGGRAAATAPVRVSPAPHTEPDPAMLAATGFDKPLVRPAAADHGRSSVMVYSLFKDGDGACSCYQWQEVDGKALEDLGRAELMEVALRAPCTTEAQRVIVVAVGGAGGRGGMPADPAAVASRMADLSLLHREPGAAAMIIPALFPNSTVVTETVSMERAKLPLGLPR